MACFYYKDGKRFNGMQDIIHEFFKDNYSLRNAAIFSAEDIQESTKKDLLKTPGATTYEDSKRESVVDLISKDHSGLFNKIGLVTKNGLLSPEYIEENRIYQYVLDNLPKVALLPDNADTSGLVYSKDKLATLKSNPEMATITDAKLITLLSEIEDMIHFEEKTTDFGTLIHAVVSLRIEKKSIASKINEFINDPKNAEIIGNAPAKDWVTKITEIADEIVSSVEKTGLPISEIFLFSNNSPVDKMGLGVKGKLDLIAIDKGGTAHIYEIKISKTEYSK